MTHWSPFTHLPQISLCLFASKPPLSKICLVAHRSFPMTETQICLPFPVRNLSYVSFQQIPIPQPTFYISPCFVYLSSGSSWVILVIAASCLRTNIPGRTGSKARRPAIQPYPTRSSQACILTNDLHPLRLTGAFLRPHPHPHPMHILVLIDHRPYGTTVLWVS